MADERGEVRDDSVGRRIRAADPPTAPGMRMRLEPARIHGDRDESLVLAVARNHPRGREGADATDANGIFPEIADRRNLSIWLDPDSIGQFRDQGPAVVQMSAPEHVVCMCGKVHQFAGRTARFLKEGQVRVTVTRHALELAPRLLAPGHVPAHHFDSHPDLSVLFDASPPSTVAATTVSRQRRSKRSCRVDGAGAVHLQHPRSVLEDPGLLPPDRHASAPRRRSRSSTSPTSSKRPRSSPP